MKNKSSIISEASRLTKYKYLSTIGVFAFLLGFYLLHRGFYFPEDVGIVGDDYRFIGTVFSSESFFWIGHFFSPWINQKLLFLSAKMGFFNSTDPLYLEKVFAFSSLPTRLLTSISLFFVFLIFCKIFKSHISGLLAFLVCATSYGVWVYSFFPNSLGAAIAVQFISIVAILYWYVKPCNLHLAIASFCTSICVFIHISSLYSCIGFAFFMMGALILKKEETFTIKLKNIFIFLIINIVLILFFYWLAVHTLKKSNIIEIMHSLSMETGGDMGNQNVPTNSYFLGLLIKQAHNLFTGLIQITNRWDPVTPFHYIVFFTQGLTLLLISVSILIHTKFSFVKRNPIIYLFLLPTISNLLGFVLTRPGSHYYILALPSNILLFIFLTLNVEQNYLKRRQVLLAIYCLTAFLYNGFGNKNVFRGNDINGNPVYAETSIIYNSLKPGEKATYLRALELDYNSEGVLGYYSSKFGNINWNTSASEWGNLENFCDFVRKIPVGQAVFMGEAEFAGLNFPTKYLPVKIISPSVVKWITHPAIVCQNANIVSP